MKSNSTIVEDLKCVSVISLSIWAFFIGMHTIANCLGMVGTGEELKKDICNKPPLRIEYVLPGRQISCWLMRSPE